MEAADEDCRSFTSDQKLIDKVVEWERKAAQQYAADGNAEGWSSDVSDEETAEQTYIRVSARFSDRRADLRAET